MGNLRVVIIAGPNGAVKTTASRRLLQGALAVNEFVNADAIAQGLSAFQPERAAIQAGRIMLDRLKELARDRLDFAFETTLASRSFARWIEELKATRAYEFSLNFFWLPSPEIAIHRVARRVILGGHHVPDDVITRRYRGGLINFFTLYRPIADQWRMYNSSAEPSPSLIASGSGLIVDDLGDASLWNRLVKENGREA